MVTVGCSRSTVMSQDRLLEKGPGPSPHPARTPVLSPVVRTPRLLSRPHTGSTRRSVSRSSSLSSSAPSWLVGSDLPERQLLQRFRHVYAGRGGKYPHGTTTAPPGVTSQEQRYKQEILEKLARTFSKKRLGDGTGRAPDLTYDTSRRSVALTENSSTTVPTVVPSPTPQHSSAESKSRPDDSPDIKGRDSQSLDHSAAASSAAGDAVDKVNQAAGGVGSAANERHLQSEHRLPTTSDDPSRRGGSTTSDGAAATTALMSRNINPQESESLQRFKMTRNESKDRKQESGRAGPILSHLSVEARKALCETREEMCTQNDDVIVAQQNQSSTPPKEEVAEEEEEDRRSAVVSSTYSSRENTVPEPVIDMDREKASGRDTTVMRSLLPARGNHSNGPQSDPRVRRKPSRGVRTSDLDYNITEASDMTKSRQIGGAAVTKPSKKAGRLTQITSVDTSRLPRESEMYWKSKGHGQGHGIGYQGQGHGIGYQGNNFHESSKPLLMREKTFKITPAGYDSRFTDIPLSLVEDDTPKEVKTKAISKCNEWINKYM